MVFHAGYAFEYSARLGDKLGTALMPAGPAGAIPGRRENLYMSKTQTSRSSLPVDGVRLPDAQIFGITNRSTSAESR